MMKQKKKKIIYNICLIFLICIFVGCAAYLAVYFLQSKKSEDQFEELESLIEEFDSSSAPFESANDGDTQKGIEFVDVDGVLVQKKMSKIYYENHDFVGWLSIDDTNVDYPVMQTPDDEEYYIHRDFYGEYSSAGTLFVDTESDVQTPSDNILIYGHNMKSGTMFHDLLKYEDEDFYKEHKYIQFDTIYGDGTYEVIAAFRTKIRAEEEAGFRYYQFFNAANKAQFDDFVANCQSLTPYTIDTDVSYGDSLITLSTCAYHTSNGRYVVVAKKITQ